MVTDDERHRVAERLRELARDVDEVSDFDLARALGLEATSRYGYDSGDVLRLADLIDPTCLARADVEDTPDGGQFECWSCSVCGNIVSVDPDYDTETDGPAYCEACGHRIVGKGEPTWL